MMRAITGKATKPASTKTTMTARRFQWLPRSAIQPLTSAMPFSSVSGDQAQAADRQVRPISRTVKKTSVECFPNHPATA
ncbi:hypothetical protein D3C83_126390 [compost metagenome]